MVIGGEQHSLRKHHQTTLSPLTQHTDQVHEGACCKQQIYSWEAHARTHGKAQPQILLSFISIYHLHTMKLLGRGGPKNTAIYASVCLLLMLPYILMLWSTSELKLDPYHVTNHERDIRE